MCRCCHVHRPCRSKDVALFIAGVVGLAAVADGHVVVLGLALVVEITFNFGILNALSINFTLLVLSPSMTYLSLIVSLPPSSVTEYRLP